MLLLNYARARLCMCIGVCVGGGDVCVYTYVSECLCKCVRALVTVFVHF